MGSSEDNEKGNKVQEKGNEDVVERETWDNKLDFILSCVGFCVGLGNVWRFPYLCYKNGGGAFLIPYFLCLMAGGVPVYFLEVGLGQFMSQGGVTAWNICPVFKGIGYGTAMINFLLNIYYVIVIAWALFYMFASFTSELPWATCGHEWNTERCYAAVCFNETDNCKPNDTVDPVQEYWQNRVLGISDGLHEMGGIRWELAGTLLLAWVLCYFCIWKGVKVTGKVVYFTATFPYVMLTILLVRGVTLPGAINGIMFYLNPDFSRLLDSQVWIDAGTQIFFSYAVALGCIIAMSSYNKFNNNFIKDCTFVCVCNSLTSLYAGFVIFSVLGFMAKQQNVSISDVAVKGPGLAFIAYPKAVSQMPMSPLWSSLFFFMILLLGLDSQFVGIEGFITAMVDLKPEFFRVHPNRRPIFIAIVAAFSYLIGLIMITNGGMYVFQLFDYYSASGMVLLWVCCCECLAIAWVYGGDKFYDNIQLMIGYRIHPFLKFCWAYVTPIITMGIMIFTIVTYKPLKYDDYEYPIWAQCLGIFMALSSMIVIPLYAIFVLAFKYEGTLYEKWKQATTPILKPHQTASESESQMMTERPPV